MHTAIEHLATSVRRIMSAGVVSLPDDASVREVQRALVAHRVHAVLILDSRTGAALGWATTTGVLEHLLGTDASLVPAALAVTEPAHHITPSASAEEALRRLLETGSSRLLVCRGEGAPADGVLAEMDLVRLTSPG